MPERITPDLCRALWTHAAGEEFGIAIETDNIKRLQKDLYDVRTADGVEAWKSLVVCLPAGGREVWLVKKTAEEALT